MLDVMQLYGSLDNYILSLRKQSGLSQDELAVLLDGGRELIGKYEQRAALPDLRRAIGLELIFDEPMQRLFAGVSDQMRGRIASRARVLLEGMADKPTLENAHRLDTLARLGYIDQQVFTSWRDDA
jgi:transcriptional regulator with XRE-family HTH domain